jgi:hypothetical protein
VKRFEHEAVPGVRAGLPLFVALALIPLSCGSDGPEMAKVTGKVTYQGKPVPKGTVTFVSPNAATHRNAVGQLDATGNYRLQTEQPGDGAQVGDYEVTVYAHDDVILDYKPKVPVPPKILTPEKYENPKTSGLKRTVKSGSNTFDLELTD